ncbi:MAG: 1,4-alpha-glucan-branching enzyme [Bacteroidales bacterium]|nr:1,4-alpha-glucan-branching enzyme [Bacteroidales bacterium]
MKKEPFYNSDPWLNPFRGIIESRYLRCTAKERELAGEGSLSDFAAGHHYYGLHRSGNKMVFREWAPGATDIYLIGPFSGWKESAEFKLRMIDEEGNWEIITGEDVLKHGELYKLSVHWKGGQGERLPSYAVRVIQDDKTKIFSAEVWDPPVKYTWKNKTLPGSSLPPLIYEAHVGMSSEKEKISTFKEFTRDIIPYIAATGYNTIQLMAIQEHPFYGSFGYHVANFFAVSSRFGTPDDLRELIDTAHGYGLRVIMDLVHSHSVKNINEGLGLFDGDPGQYFHTGERRNHIAWDSLCFNYGKNKVLHFLLSNCRYWLEEYRFDGFRFDGVTSMIYYDHGLGRNFVSYSHYFDGGQDEDALVYLFLANRLIHDISPGAITIAEEMSGMPGIAAPTGKTGYGFDYRLSMGVPDYWIKLVKDTLDEAWDMGSLMHELSQHRPEEKVVSYCESHDQALVGDKTLIFRMIDADMYSGMNIWFHNLNIDRGIALHKMIRLITFATSGGGYLNFMGNEFGHPEWIDFPREGNKWSFKYARRQWSLVKDRNLKYHQLAEFDRKMLALDHGGKLLGEPVIKRIVENSADKVIAFMRGDLLFVFNFHPVTSYTDYGIQVAGKFRIVLDSDDPSFGGFNRIDRTILYRAIKRSEKATIKDSYFLYLYLPSRTALVFKKEPVRKVTEL